MANSTAYSFINVTATIDGQIVQGLWEGDDSIIVTPATDRGVMLIGADGSGIFSASANQSVTISIKLQHTSPAHRLLTQKLKRQMALGGAASAFPFTMIDSVSGEGGVADRCFIMTSPADSKGINAAVREWVLTTAEWVVEVPNG